MALSSAILKAGTSALNTGAQIYNNERNIAFNKSENQKNRIFQHDEAMLEREWSERMSNTAYQRTVADLKNAGLNPLLAYSNAPSLAPSGASAQNVGSSAYSSNAPVVGDMSQIVDAYNKPTAKQVREQNALNLEQQRLDVAKAYADINTAKNSSRLANRQMKINLVIEKEQERQAQEIYDNVRRGAK